MDNSSHIEAYRRTERALNVLGNGLHTYPAAIVLLTALQLGESSYSRGWIKKDSTGNVTRDERSSFNMGAVQKGNWPGKTFEWGDTHADGKAYSAQFRAYATADEGTLDAVRIATRTDAEREALRRGNASDFASALYAAKYYEGHGSPLTAKTGKAKALFRDSLAIAAAVGVPSPERGSLFPVGSCDYSNGSVNLLEIQKKIGAKVDGVFGPETFVRLCEYAAKH